MGHVRQTCERAHVWISLELDNELAEVESGLLDRHLATCEECVAYRERTHAFTSELRASAALPFRSNVTLLRRRRRVPARRIVHLAAAAVAMLTIGGTVGHSLADRNPTVTPGPVVTVVSVRNEPGVGSQAPLATVRHSLPLGQKNAAEDF
jgi:predicted anti-sigma-YlaC factor YlaD